ncbi:unannotated protein [freshwater metagenome]|uniref:Unannotated protein n=1 Tax=freshwater metagenome TaxID=449393 RepID=A0A6J6YDX5_9ZZZZ
MYDEATDEWVLIGTNGLSMVQKYAKHGIKASRASEWCSTTCASPVVACSVATGTRLRTPRSAGIGARRSSSW